MPKIPLAVKVLTPIIGLAVTVVAVVATLGMLKAWWSLPFGPAMVKAEQPIQFRHDLHIAEAIDCQFCHREVTEGPAATLPAVQQCYFCHQVIKQVAGASGPSPELAKIEYAYTNNLPINWVRVHRMPDHVHFVHDAHVLFFSKQNQIAPSQVCSICHGDVAKMQIAEQVRNLKMRDCVDCHRNGYLSHLTDEAAGAIKEAVESGQRLPPPTDCAACHY